MSVALACVRLTVNWPSLVGVSFAAASVAAIDAVALSLSAIVTVAVRSAASGSRVICGSPLTPVRVTITVSSASTSESSTMPVTSITADRFPARIVTLPVRAV